MSTRGTNLLAVVNTFGTMVARGDGQSSVLYRSLGSNLLIHTGSCTHTSLNDVSNRQYCYRRRRTVLRTAEMWKSADGQIQRSKVLSDIKRVLNILVVEVEAAGNREGHSEADTSMYLEAK